MAISAIQKLKLQAVWSDLNFLTDEKLTSDQKLTKIDDFDNRVKAFIPDDNERAAAIQEFWDTGIKIAEQSPELLKEAK